MKQNLLMGIIAVLVIVIIILVSFLMKGDSDKSPVVDDGIIIKVESTSQTGQDSGSNDSVRTPPALPN